MTMPTLRSSFVSLLGEVHPELDPDSPEADMCRAYYMSGAMRCYALLINGSRPLTPDELSTLNRELMAFATELGITELDLFSAIGATPQ